MYGYYRSWIFSTLDDVLLQLSVHSHQVDYSMVVGVCFEWEKRRKGEGKVVGVSLAGFLHEGSNNAGCCCLWWQLVALL